MPARDDKLRAIIAKIENDKANGRFDQIMSRDATLLVSMFDLPNFSEAAFKANIKADGNAKIITRLIMALS
jgi:hypothetical protein